MNTEFEEFVQKAGSAANAARMLGCSESLISLIRSGTNQVSKKIARKIVDLYPEMSLTRLLFPEDKAA